jgi:hypothetical protein
MRHVCIHLCLLCLVLILFCSQIARASSINKQLHTHPESEECVILEHNGKVVQARAPAEVDR